MGESHEYLFKQRAHYQYLKFGWDAKRLPNAADSDCSRLPSGMVCTPLLFLCVSQFEPGAEGNGPGVQETVGKADVAAFASWSRAGLTIHVDGDDGRKLALRASCSQTAWSHSPNGSKQSVNPVSLWAPTLPQMLMCEPATNWTHLAPKRLPAQS